jgi:hypothetical protein
MALINRQLEDIWNPGEVLLPRIRTVLGAVLLFSALYGAALLYSSGTGRQTDAASLACLALGCGLVLYYLRAARRGGAWAKRSLMYGLVLLASVFTRPLQVPLYEADWPSQFANGAVGLVDLSALSALIVPAVVAGAVARVGHTVYLLGGGAEVAPNLEGRPNLFTRRLKRLQRQEFIVRPLLLLALCAALAQSGPAQEYLDGRREKLPVFASNGADSEVELRGVPVDGRVVRVAMVAAEDEAEAQSAEAKPAEAPAGGGDAPSPDQTVAAVVRALKDGGLIPLEAKNVWGDVWLYTEGGKIQGWWTSPIRCLYPTRAAGDVVTFDLRARCSYGPRARVRLVAVVYDRRHSEFVLRMPIPEVEEDVIMETVYPSDSWLLVDTASPFVRAVWSPVSAPGLPSAEATGAPSP